MIDHEKSLKIVIGDLIKKIQVCPNRRDDFGPHRILKPGETVNPNDVTEVNGMSLIPVSKYGNGGDSNG